MTTAIEDLLACPFCGEELNLYLTPTNVGCDGCGCEGPPAENSQMAIEKWNE